jgi:hypothetical protein
MDRDARRMRGPRPFLFANLKEGRGVAEVARFIADSGDLKRDRARRVVLPCAAPAALFACRVNRETGPHNSWSFGNAAAPPGFG